MDNTKTKLDIAKILQGLIDLLDATKKRLCLVGIIEGIVADEGWKIKIVSSEETMDNPKPQIKLVPNGTKGEEINDMWYYLNKATADLLVGHLLNDFFGNGGKIPNIYEEPKDDNNFENEIVDLVFDDIAKDHKERQDQYLEMITRFSVFMDDGISGSYTNMLLATIIQTLWCFETEVYDYRVVEETLKSLGIPLLSGITFFRKRGSKPTMEDMEFLQRENPDKFLPYRKK